MSPIRISLIEDAANTEDTETRVSFGKGEVLTSKILRSPPRLATSRSGSTDPSGAPEFTPVFSGTPVTGPLALYIFFVDR